MSMLFIEPEGKTCSANSTEDPVRRGQRQVEQVKLKIGMSMDDKTFQVYLLETQVSTMCSVTDVCLC
jgi:hypothetical protein